jgi:hypothetical protein
LHYQANTTSNKTKRPKLSSASASQSSSSSSSSSSTATIAASSQPTHLHHLASALSDDDDAGGIDMFDCAGRVQGDNLHDEDDGDEFEQHASNPTSFTQQRLDRAVQFVRFGVLTGYRAPVSSSSTSTHRISTIYDYQDAMQRVADRECQSVGRVPGSFAMPISDSTSSCFADFDE